MQLLPVLHPEGTIEPSLRLPPMRRKRTARNAVGFWRDQLSLIVLCALCIGSVVGPIPAVARGTFGHDGQGERTPAIGSGSAITERKETKKLKSRKRPNRAHDAHYLFGPSAIPMEAFSGYYQNQDVLMHSAYYAPMDGLTLGGGVQVASLFSSLAAGSHGPMFHLRVNGGGNVGNGIYMGGYAMGMRLGENLEMEDGVSLPTNLGLGAALATFSTEHFHVSASLGVSADRNGFGSGPLVGLCGLWYLTSRTALITENWNIPLGTEQYRVYSYGARFTHRTMCADVAFAINDELKDIFFLGLPVLGFLLRF